MHKWTEHITYQIQRYTQQKGYFWCLIHTYCTPNRWCHDFKTDGENEADKQSDTECTREVEREGEKRL